MTYLKIIAHNLYTFKKVAMVRGGYNSILTERSRFMKQLLMVTITLLAFLAAPVFAVEETPQSIPGGTMV